MPAFGTAITSGSIFIQYFPSSGTFNLAGRNFAVDGVFDLGNWGPAHCFWCDPGTVIDVGSVQSGTDFRNGSATIDGVSYPNVLWGSLDNLGPSLFLAAGPGIVLDHGAGMYFGTFTFTGMLCGATDFTGVCTVDLPFLAGSGTVAVKIISWDIDGRTYLNFDEATYTFATPEPASIVLLGTAVIGLSGMLRRGVFR